MSFEHKIQGLMDKSDKTLDTIDNEMKQKIDELEEAKKGIKTEWDEKRDKALDQFKKNILITFKEISINPQLPENFIQKLNEYKKQYKKTKFIIASGFKEYNTQFDVIWNEEKQKWVASWPEHICEKMRTIDISKEPSKIENIIQCWYTLKHDVEFLDAIIDGKIDPEDAIEVF